MTDLDRRGQGRSTYVGVLDETRRLYRRLNSKRTHNVGRPLQRPMVGHEPALQSDTIVRQSNYLRPR